MKIKRSLTTRLMLSVGLIIIGMSVINILWGVLLYERQAQAEMKEKAAVIAQQLMATRAFIAEKQDVINSDREGNFQFKHLNPAAVGKGLGHIFTQYTGYRLKQTREDARAAENTPDTFELEKLAQMRADPGMDEVWGYGYIEGERVFRYLLPLYYTNECMPCHGGPAGEIDIAGYPKEGAMPGEFAGAVSVVFSTKNMEINIRDTIFLQCFYSFVILLLSLYGIYLVMGRIVITPVKELTQKAKELGKGDWEAQINPESAFDEMRGLGVAFNVMAHRLQESYAGLEDKVEERTLMLRLANERLREQSEELQSMNARLSEADRLKSEFLAVMSHELRTPLTAIIAFSEMLLTDRQDLTELQNEYLNDILESAHSLHGQINDILDMSKIEAGLLTLNRQTFGVGSVLDGLKFSMGSLFVKKGIWFSVSLDPDTPELLADYDKVRHILQNLLSNAVKFTPEGGCVRVDIAPDGASGGQWVRVRVSDNGIGIECEELPRIFSRFWQTRTEGRLNEGSGLGLAIVKNLVELHGGWIQVESEWRRGTAFTFVLPANCSPGE